MKKGLRIVFLILVLLIGVGLLIRYVLFPIVSVGHLYDNIPDAAAYVVLVDTEELIDGAITDFVSSPGRGNPFDSDDDDDDDDKDKYELKDILKKGLWHGLELPEQVIFYVNEFGDEPQIVLLPLSDSEAFSAFLTETQDKSGLVADEHQVWVDSSYALQVHDDYLKLFLGTLKSNHNLLAKGVNWQARLTETKQGALASAFLTDKGEATGQLSLHSSQGALRFSFQSHEPLEFEPLGQSSSAAAWMALQYGPDLESLKKGLQAENHLARALGQAGIDAKQLAKVWNGRFDLCINGLTAVEEEIVTYSYDDNFEKIEHRELKEFLEADFNAHIGLTRPTDSLFYKQGWVKTEDGEDLFVKYPIQEVHYAEEEGVLRLHSKSALQEDCIQSPGGGQFMYIDWAALEEDWNEGREEEKQFHAGLSIIKASVDTEHEQVIMDLEFTDDARQGFFSLLESLDF